MAVAAILSLAACSTIEPVDSPDSLITFAVVNKLPQTRVAGLVYDNGPFGTFAWWHADAWTSTADASKLSNIFMDNQQIDKNTTTNVWAPTVDYYWTKTGYLTFASYSPYVTGAQKGFSAVPVYTVDKGFTFDDYTIQNLTNDAAIDVMYADLATDCTKNTNTDGTAVTDNASTESGFKGVPTIFHHALTKVGVALKVKNDYKNANVDNINVIVKDVKLVTVNSKGDFVQLPAAAWTSDGSVTDTYAYLTEGTDTPITLYFFQDDDYTTPKPVVTDFTNTNVVRLLLPQTLTVNDPSDATDLLTAHQHVAVKYTVRTWYHSNATPVDEEVTTTALLKNVTVPSWTPNMSVIYNITINPYADDPITFDPAVLDWEAVVSSPVTVGE